MRRQNLDAYAFALALGCSVALLALAGALSLRLPGERRTADMPQPARKAS